MSRQSQLETKIKQIDWDFQGALSHYGLHRLHWYPGTFIPQIPAYLIELFTHKGDTVYDPFCGVGTTLLEAVRLGRRAIGTDVNDIALMVAKAKLTFFTQDTLKARVEEFRDQLTNRCELYGLGYGGPLFAKAALRRSPAIGQRFSTLEKWYHPETWREMLVLRELVDDISGPFRRLLDVVFSQIVKRCCSQRHHWGYVADNMVPKKLVYEDAISAFNRALEDTRSAFERFLESPHLRTCSIRELNERSRVVRANLLDGPVVEDESVDLVVTSPPYPNVTDYTRAQRLSLWWFEKSVEELRESEIGARYKRSRATALTVYFEEMKACIQNIVRCLRPEKHLCLVIGESEKQRIEWDVVNTLRDMILNVGFDMPFDRIQRNRSRERLRRRDGNLSNEYILVFRNKR